MAVSFIDISLLRRVVESLIIGQMAKMDATLADISKIDQNIKNVRAKLARLSRDKVQYFYCLTL